MRARWLFQKKPMLAFSNEVVWEQVVNELSLSGLQKELQISKAVNMSFLYPRYMEYMEFGSRCSTQTMIYALMLTITRMAIRDQWHGGNYNSTLLKLGWNMA